MMENEGLREWLDKHNITYTIRHDLVIIPGFGRCLIQSDYDHIFKIDKASGKTMFNSMENVRFLKDDDINYVVFPFGKRWYYVDVNEDLSTAQFHILRWVGQSPKMNFVLNAEFYPLGLHSGYELLNGSGLIKDYCTKAKWLGYNGLGISDKNTMAATLDLQTSATTNQMRYVFGYSTDVVIGDCKIGVKIYSQTQKGFRNLLRIQKVACVDNVEHKEIAFLDLLQYSSGNVLVFDKLCGHWLAQELGKRNSSLQDLVEAYDGWVYFQVDVSEYKAERIDSQVLLSIKKYFDNFYCGGLDYKLNVRPVLIQDVYYIDKEDWRNKIVLNKVDTGAAHEQSDRQYFKTIDELYAEFRTVFSDKYSDNVFRDMCNSTADIAENAEAAYDLSENYAPKYDMTPEEVSKYGTTYNMFCELIEEGFRKLVPDGEEELYRKRVEYEKYVISSTDNIDYFLIQRDELNWAQSNGILTGIGRGSAGGCLILYLMGITYIDPIKYGLIFERFLLPQRAGLEAHDVTKIAENIESDDYYSITLDNGKTYNFDRDAQFLVRRGGQEAVVYADELQDDDDIVWDNNDMLWSL